MQAPPGGTGARVFLLFAYELLDPRGGAQDCVGVFPSLDSAQRAARQPWGDRRPIDRECCEIYEVVAEGLALRAQARPDPALGWYVAEDEASGDYAPPTDTTPAGGLELPPPTGR